MADQQTAWGQPQQQAPPQQAHHHHHHQGGMRGRGRGGYNQPQLPPGWQLAFAPTGEPYYVDHNTRTTHWQLPAQYQQMNQQGQYGGRGGRGRGRAGIDSQKRKTKMCMNFENGSCAWGDKCAFAHGAHELLQTTNTNTNTNNNQQQQGQQQQGQTAAAPAETKQ